MFGAQKILTAVQAGLQIVPQPVRRAMRSKTALAGCVVVGGALTAYGHSEVSGSQAIAGVGIGLGIVAMRQIPIGKIISIATSLGRRK